MDVSGEIREALELAKKSKSSFFITGKAGTGKSTFVQKLKEEADKNMALLAPTGVAAVNIKGQTIHSFFGFKPGVTEDNLKGNYRKKELYKRLETLVIDEISMVRADLLDCVGKFLRITRRSGRPFGGVQVIMVGDLYQLPPIVRRDERNFFRTRYETPYFFSSKEFQNLSPETIRFRQVHRQTEPEFVSMLNKIRRGDLDSRDLEVLNRNVVADFDFEEGGIFLTTTNRKADDINRNQLANLSGDEFSFSGKIKGSFPESHLPTAKKLSLKVGAKVMLLSNDPEGRWINGDVGRVIEIKKEEPMLRVELDSGRVVKVSENKWDRIKYDYDSEKDTVRSEEVGSFSQLPIRLSWAVTIHKAQGKTFDNVTVDFQNGTFSHGQAYVALSRCTNLKGLKLKRPIRKSDIIVDRRVVNFLN